MEIQGEIINKSEIESFGSNGFQKQTVVIKTSDRQYPQEIPVEFHNDRTDLTHPFNLGENVKIGINLRGRYSEAAGRWFPSIVGWRIEKV